MSNICGIIRDENGRLEDVLRKNATDFTYSNEMTESVVYSFLEDIDAVPSSRMFFEIMLETVTAKMHEKGIPVKGFIFTKNSIVVLQEDDVTAYVVDWPGTENIRKINVSVTTEDTEDEDLEDYSAEYVESVSSHSEDNQPDDNMTNYEEQSGDEE